MVLELVKGILGVGAVAVELGDGEDFARQRGHQHGVFVDDGVIGELGKAQTQLVRVARIDQGQIGFDLPAQHDGAACATPARQAQRGVGPLPTLAGVAPFGAAHEAFDELLNPFGHAQLEQIRQVFLLGAGHVGLRAPVAIAANRHRPVCPRQAPEQLPQTRRAVLGRRLITGLHLHVQYQAQVGDEIGVVGV